MLFQRVQDVLEGRCNRLDLLRKYHADANRLGVMLLPATIPAVQLRLAVVEELMWQAIQFVATDTAGGPIAQTLTPTGGMREVQEFPTRVPAYRPATGRRLCWAFPSSARVCGG